MKKPEVPVRANIRSPEDLVRFLEKHLPAVLDPDQGVASLEELQTSLAKFGLRMKINDIPVQ